ncbi:MAG: SOS response-associated peptidase [Anaerolineae bacterium]|nr:SOS response-associated peptidase [Anaerolineae bacterium]
MCGRFTLSANVADLAARFMAGQTAAVEGLRPRYNIAPMQKSVIIKNEEPDALTLATWGLIPVWSKDASIASKLINARGETVAEKPSFRSAFKKRRCLVLADGFYEWQKSADGKSKTPMLIRLASGEPFAMAGLWENWKPLDAPESEWRSTFTVITIGPNELMSPIHDRMPVILPRGRERYWLNPGGGEVELHDLIRPYPAQLMHARPVSSRVNSVKNDDSSLILEQTQANLL